MPVIAPFRGLRYDLRKVKSLKQVVTPPYDVISPEGQARYYRLHPYNFIRVVYGKSYPSDTPHRNRYTRARDTFDRWIQEGVLRPDPKPSLYPHCQEYALEGRRYRRWGVMTLVRLDSTKVYPHENVRQEPKTDRLRLLKALQAPLSPIFGLIPDQRHSYQRFLERACRLKKPVASVYVEGVRHLLWRMDEPSWIQRLQRLLAAKELVIADGHHRFEAALQYRKLQERSPSDLSSDAPYHYAMFYLACCALHEPGLLPTHRVLKGVSDAKRQTLLKSLEEKGSLQAVRTLHQLTLRLRHLKGQGRLGVGLYTGNGHGYLLESLRGNPFKLDVEWLHQGILPLFNGDEVIYTPHLKEAAALVCGDRHRILFVMQPPTLTDVLTRARAALRMPRKTTYFYPKPLAGLVEYSFQFS